MWMWYWLLGRIVEGIDESPVEKGCRNHGRKFRFHSLRSYMKVSNGGVVESDLFF